ncbi:MAG: alkaline phosphatase family protein [Armatimonadota bacterium]
MSAEPARPPVLVIGLDGAGFELLDPLLAEGRLPNLARLRGEGVGAGLESVHPPVSAPAWASFSTGVQPGKHGVIDFMSVLPGTRNPVPVNANWCRAPRLWHYAGDRGLRTICFNIPLTYPPHPLNGLLVAGPLTPHPRSTFTHPADLRDEIESALGPYRMEPSRKRLQRAGPERAVELANAHIRRRVGIWLHLLREHPWELSIGVLRTSDLMQHAFLLPEALAQDGSGRLVGPNGEAIARHYEFLDACVGELRAAAPENATTVVVSDHGAGLAERFFCLGEWLQQQGLLRRSRLPIIGADLIMIRWRSFGRFLRACRVEGLGKLLPPRLLEAQFPTIQATRRDVFSRGIDWRRTLAAPDPGVRHGIRINLRGRDPNGIVEAGGDYEELRDRVIASLNQVRHPATNEPVIENAWRREELYHGPHIELAPDIVIRTVRDDVVPLREFNRGRVFAGQRFGQMAVHKRWGIFLAAGQELRRGASLDDLHLTDMAPTILHLLGLPVPSYMDGRVAEAAFAPAALAARPVQHEEAAAVERDLVGEEEVDERVTQRLRDLGYLD